MKYNSQDKIRVTNIYLHIYEYVCVCCAISRNSESQQREPKFVLVSESKYYRYLHAYIYGHTNAHTWAYIFICKSINGAAKTLKFVLFAGLQTHGSPLKVIVDFILNLFSYLLFFKQMMFFRLLVCYYTGGLVIFSRNVHEYMHTYMYVCIWRIYKGVA